MIRRFAFLKAAIILFFVIIVTGFSLTAYATFISPKRVIIKDKQRAAAILILNQSDKNVVYSFEWERRAQDTNGESVMLEPGETLAGYKPVDEYLQFSPRKFILKPGESQRVRILVRRPVDMAEGEYHSHILIKADPLEEQYEGEAVPGGALGGVINMRSYNSIPVFLHHGTTKVDFNITGVQLTKKDGMDFIRINLNNNSTRSIYLAAEIDCKTSSGEVVNKQLASIRLYAEAKTKTQDLPTGPLGFPVSQCVDATLKLMGTDDIEYKYKEVTRIPLTP